MQRGADVISYTSKYILNVMLQNSDFIKMSLFSGKAWEGGVGFFGFEAFSQSGPAARQLLEQ